MPRELFCFSHHSGVFSLCMVGFYTLMGRFYTFPGLQAHLSCISQGYTSAGLYPARFSSALIHSAPQWPGGIPSGSHTARIRTGHDSGTALHHLCIAHFRHCFRFIHPQSTVHLRQLLSTHPVGKEPEVPHHLKKLLRDVLFQPRDQLTLCQRFRRRFSRFVVQVTEAQARPSVVMCQPGGCYRRLLQITTQVARRIPPVGRFLRHVHQARNSSGRGNEIPFRLRIDSSKPTYRQNRCCKNGSDHRSVFQADPIISAGKHHSLVHSFCW